VEKGDTFTFGFKYSKEKGRGKGRKGPWKKGGEEVRKGTLSYSQADLGEGKKEKRGEKRGEE